MPLELANEMPASAQDDILLINTVLGELSSGLKRHERARHTMACAALFRLSNHISQLERSARPMHFAPSHLIPGFTTEEVLRRSALAGHDTLTRHREVSQRGCLGGEQQKLEGERPSE